MNALRFGADFAAMNFDEIDVGFFVADFELASLSRPWRRPTARI